MDNLIELAKDLAHELQKDERFIRTQMAQAAADEDAELQNLIGEFNLKRIALNNESTKEEKDGEKTTRLDGEIREVYDKIMQNPHMNAYQAAKEELDGVVRYMATILTLSAQGQDPEHIDDPSCGGNCAGCSGCH